MSHQPAASKAILEAQPKPIPHLVRKHINRHAHELALAYEHHTRAKLVATVRDALAGGALPQELVEQLPGYQDL
jgi:hypothetical protein